MTVATDSVCVLSIEFMVRTHQLGCYGLPKSDPFLAYGGYGRLERHRLCTTLIRFVECSQSAVAEQLNHPPDLRVFPSTPDFVFSRQTRRTFTNGLDTQTLAPKPSPRFYQGDHRPPRSGTADINFSWRRTRGSGVRTSLSVGSHTLKGYPSTFRSCLETL